MPGDRYRREHGTFNLINGVLLRPLPFDEPQQIVMAAIRESRNEKAGPVSLEGWRRIQNSSAPFEQLAIRTFLPVSVASLGPARMVQSEFVSGDYFDLLRLRPLVGRLFSAAADQRRT